MTSPNTPITLTGTERVAVRPIPAAGSGFGATESVTTTQDIANLASAGSAMNQLTGDVTAGPGGGSQVATIAANAVTTTKILDANVTAAKLAGTTVVAGSYANANITVDAQGRLTAASGGGVGSSSVQYTWAAGVDPDKAIIYTAAGGEIVTGVTGRLGAANGATATVYIEISADGTAPGSGTVLTLEMDANGTPNTNQTLTFTQGVATVVVNDPGDGSGTPGAVTITGTTGTGTKFQATGTIIDTVTAAAVNGAGTGGTPGAATIIGTTGTGTKFHATGTIDGSGHLTDPLVVTVAGAYTVDPTTTAEPVTGGGLTGATVDLTMSGGLLTDPLVVSVPGDYTVDPTTTGEAVTGGSLSAATVNLTLADVSTELNSGDSLLVVSTGTFALADGGITIRMT